MLTFTSWPTSHGHKVEPCLTNYLHKLFSKQICRNTHFKGVQDFDLQPNPEAWTLGPIFMAWKQTLLGTHGLNMNAFWWVVGEIYPLRETLTEDFDVNSTNATESNEQPNEHTNGQTERPKLFTPRHKCRGYNLPLGINAGGITTRNPFFYWHFLGQ